MEMADKPVHYSERKGKHSKKRVAGIIDPVYIKSVRDVSSEFVTDMATKVKNAVTPKAKKSSGDTITLNRRKQENLK
jgi:hypothetical protein